MHNLDILEILAVGFTCAFAFGFITHRLKLSPIVGYLLAGFLVGPHSPGFVADQHIASQLSEIGVILLMFGVGLHFDLKDLLAVRRIAVPGAVGQSLVATALGAVIGVSAGLSMGGGIVLGFGIAVASTVVLMRVLVDNNMLDTVHGHVAVGWLIVEDIFTVLVLVLLPAIATALQAPGQFSVWGLLGAFALALGKMALMVALLFPVGGRVIPWLMAHVARSRSRELFTLAVLVLAFAIAMGATVFFGVSIALGAFLAGMVVGRTGVSHQAAADILPMRDAFAVLFFLSVGMLFDPRLFTTHSSLVLQILAVVLLAKPLAAFLIVLVLGYSLRTAMVVAVGLGQIGEFSFILAGQAQQLKLFPESGISILVACALVSITLNPLLFQAIDPVERALLKWPWLRRLLNRHAERTGRAANQKTQERLAGQNGGRAIVVGYGPVGQSVARLLRESALTPVIIEMNVDTVSRLVDEGQVAVYGDASQRDILKAAGIDRARHLLITLPDINATISVISTARQLNPGIKILVRARYLGSQPILEGLGVHAISFEEEEVARAMTERVNQEVPKEK